MLELAELNDEERATIAVGRALELDEPADRDELAALVGVVRLLRRMTAQDAATIFLRTLYG
jgi:hypothetical protein